MPEKQIGDDRGRESCVAAIVTGLGALSALGHNASEFWTGLNSGKSGISRISGYCHDYLRNAHAGEVHALPEMIGYAKEKSIESRLSLFAHWAIEEALKDCGLSRASLRTKKVGLVLGVSLGMSLVSEAVKSSDIRLEGAANTGSDFSQLAADVSESFGILGEAIVVSTACASGTNAISIAKDMICWEGYDAVICGGVDTLDRMKYLGHTALSTLSPTSVKPFTALRDGTLFGEGAGILVLENSSSRDHRLPYAECSGGGYSCDAKHVTAPDESGVGAVHVMRESLRDAGVQPAVVGYLNLHGSGTPLNDDMECQAVHEVFGSATTSLYVSSIKPAIGHAMGAAGALEAVATVLSVKHQRIPPTLNVADEHSILPLRLVRGRSIKTTIDHALSNSFGFGGCNGAVLFSKLQTRDDSETR